jgi:hypothetical protein
MNKKLLLEKYIKVAVRKALEEAEQQQKRAEKAMYLVYRFPGLKKVVEDLMSPSFGRFVSGVDIVAPKPTTFKVDLINGQDFTVKYLGNKKWDVKVSGKKYNCQNIGETERASQAIADLLELSYAPKEGEEPAGAPAPPASSGGSSSSSTPSAPNPKDQELAADLAGAAPEVPAGGEEAPAAPEEEETPPAEA